MSFYEQERALLDLLFNPALRDAFCSQSTEALGAYDLTASELADFATIRPDALKMDAAMRIRLILSHLGKHLPLSLSLVSATDNGTAFIESLISSHLMQAKPHDRPAFFADELARRLPADAFSNDEIYQQVLAVIQAEGALCLTAAQLKQAVLNGEEPDMTPPDLSKHWVEKPITLAPHVSLGVLPLPYLQLKKAFCPKPGTELWPHLKQMPLPKSLLENRLASPDPRLLVARARISEHSRCDPVIDHFTAELAQGFAPIFQHINGSMSVNALLAQLKHAGAHDGLLQSVQTGLLQLLESGFLELDE